MITEWDWSILIWLDCRLGCKAHHVHEIYALSLGPLRDAELDSFAIPQYVKVIETLIMQLLYGKIKLDRNR